MIYYAIRHKATGELMPQAKRDRGYSHWNPSNKNTHLGHGMQQALPIPRLIDTRRKAARCIIIWASMPNAKMTFVRSDWDGTEEADLDITDDKRKKEDLEVVEINLKIKGPNDPFWKNS